MLNESWDKKICSNLVGSLSHSPASTTLPGRSDLLHKSPLANDANDDEAVFGVS